MKKLNIRTKIMLWFTFLSIILMSAFIPTVYTTVSASLRQTMQANLQLTVSQIFSSVEIKNGQMVFDTEELDIEDGIVFQILLPDGTILYENKTRIPWENVIQKEGVTQFTVDGELWMMQTQPYEINDKKILIMAASPMHYVSQSLDDLMLHFVGLVPIYFLFSVVGASFLAKRAMKPIHQIIETVQAIGKGDLTQRICGIDTKDEIGELAKTFNGMLDTLEESFRRERRFTSDASHELRTPIAVISACAEDMLDERAANNCENIQVIKKEAERMAKMIAQLLMLSRGYEGRYHFERECICLSDMVDSVLEELCEKAEKRKITTYNQVTKEVILRADQSLMTQLWINLVGNAIKYGKDGGHIWIDAQQKENKICLRISDDGIGIEEKDIPYIFERFYRSDKARDRNGSGLGLAIVKWIVTLHGGKIFVKSKLGYGTMFEIELPDEIT